MASINLPNLIKIKIEFKGIGLLCTVIEVLYSDRDSWKENENRKSKQEAKTWNDEQFFLHLSTW